MYNKDKTTISQNSSTKHSAFNIYQLFPQRTEDECLAELKQYPKLYWTYKNWPDDWKKRFMEFMEGAFFSSKKFCQTIPEVSLIA